MNWLRIGSLAAALSPGACTPVAVAAHAGYAQVAVSGEVALAEGTAGTGGAPEQDVQSAFGLGEDQGSPFVRARFGFDRLVVTASGFGFEESGSGVLEENFGGLAAATPVASDLYFACAKISGVYDFDLGFVTLSPGLAIDVVDLEFQVRELALGNGEEIDEIVGIPMVFARARSTLGPVDLVAEAGYMEANVDSSGGHFLDAEAMLEASPTERVRFSAGYRFIEFDATGDTGSDSFRVDLEVQGWFVGGGITF